MLGEKERMDYGGVGQVSRTEVMIRSVEEDSQCFIRNIRYQGDSVALFCMDGKDV